VLFESGDRAAALAVEEEAFARLADGESVPPDMRDRLRMFRGSRGF
jgi:hypothetical protein